jgi:hypothetical protein
MRALRGHFFDDGPVDEVAIGQDSLVSSHSRSADCDYGVNAGYLGTLAERVRFSA